MICEERAEMKHGMRVGLKTSMSWGFSLFISKLRLSLITAEEDLPITPHSETNWLHDRQLSLRIWQARYLWQSYDPIQAGSFPPK